MKLEDHPDVVTAHMHIEQPHHVGMLEPAQQGHFPHCEGWHAVPTKYLGVIRDFLNGHDLVGAHVLGFRDLAEGTLAEVLHDQVVAPQAASSSLTQGAETRMSLNDLP